MNQKVTKIILIIALLASGIVYFLLKSNVGHNISNIVQQDKQTVNINIWIEHIATDSPDNLFQIGEHANLIIRNRPHGKLLIKNINCQDLKIQQYYLKRYGVIPNSQLTNQPAIFQCLITLQDNNTIETSNGYLSNGNQLKIGNRIHIEGKLYSLQGSITGINK